MALIYANGFDHYTNADFTLITDTVKKEWDYYSLGNTYSESTARTGMALTSNVNTHLGKYFDTPLTTIVVGLAFYNQSLNWTPFVVRGTSDNGYSDHCGIYVDSTGRIQGFRNNSTYQATFSNYSTSYSVLLGTATVPLIKTFAGWSYLEAKFVLSDTVGSITVKFNGTEVLNTTGVDTLFNSTTAGGVGFNGAGLSDSYWDDLYIADTDFLGEIRVVTLLPSTGNGSNTDWTPSTGTDHGALVDEAAPNITDYVSSSTLNQIDTWNYPAVGYTGTIKAVAMNHYCMKGDAGSRAISAVTRPASTNRVNSKLIYPPGSFAYYQSIWDNNPEDSAAWEVADVDGAEFGVKVTV